MPTLAGRVAESLLPPSGVVDIKSRSAQPLIFVGYQGITSTPAGLADNKPVPDLPIILLQASVSYYGRDEGLKSLGVAGYSAVT